MMMTVAQAVAWGRANRQGVPEGSVTDPKVLQIVLRHTLLVRMQQIYADWQMSRGQYTTATLDGTPRPVKDPPPPDFTDDQVVRQLAILISHIEDLL